MRIIAVGAVPLMAMAGSVGTDLLRTVSPAAASLPAPSPSVATQSTSNAQAHAHAYPYPDVDLTGHGWGGGVGMGQWGALGYAIGQDSSQGNWTYQQILTHFYGGTSLQTDGNDTQTVQVALTENNGNDVIATAPGGVTVPTGGTATAVLFAPIAGDSGWLVQTGSGCAGPWTTVGTVGNPERPTTRSATGGLVTLCQGAGNETYHGQLQAVYNSNDALRTVNVVELSEYLDDVVPSESSSGWGSIGGAGPQSEQWGFQELEAQAVAARSYVLSDPLGYGGYADTCDQACQSYPGTKNQSALSDAAVADSAGEVMEEGTTPGGSVATTQYSASTGGYSAGGPFPAVPDAGDAVCLTAINVCNPNHTWSASIPVASVQATWPAIGTLATVTVTSRDGNGDLGGRVDSMTLAGSAGSVSVTGEQFADSLGLKSNWFAVTSNASGGVGGYRMAGSDGTVFDFGNAADYGSMAGKPLNQPIVGMAATPDGQGYWEVASDGGIFTFGDAKFYGSMGGKPLNQPIVGMAATPDGQGYWEVASDGGIFTFGDAKFYGSMGGKPLNQPIVGMAADPGGGGYWIVASDGGIFSFGNARFHGSMGGTPLVRPVVAMAATTDGGGYWMVAADGGIFTFGSAPFEGSGAGSASAAGTVAMIPTADEDGYLLVTSTGGVVQLGDATEFGDVAGQDPSYVAKVVGGAATPG